MTYLLLLKTGLNSLLKMRFVDKKTPHKGVKKIYLNAFKRFSHFQQEVEKLVLSALTLRPNFTLPEF